MYMGNLGVHMICMDLFLTRPFDKQLNICSKKKLYLYFIDKSINLYKTILHVAQTALFQKNTDCALEHGSNMTTTTGDF